MNDIEKIKSLKQIYQELILKRENRDFSNPDDGVCQNINALHVCGLGKYEKVFLNSLHNYSVADMGGIHIHGSKSRNEITDTAIKTALFSYHMDAAIDKHGIEVRKAIHDYYGRGTDPIQCDDWPYDSIEDGLRVAEYIMMRGVVNKNGISIKWILAILDSRYANENIATHYSMRECLMPEYADVENYQEIEPIYKIMPMACVGVELPIDIARQLAQMEYWKQVAGCLHWTENYNLYDKSSPLHWWDSFWTATLSKQSFFRSMFGHFPKAKPPFVLMDNAYIALLGVEKETAEIMRKMRINPFHNFGLKAFNRFVQELKSRMEKETFQYPLAAKIWAIFGKRAPDFLRSRQKFSIHDSSFFLPYLASPELVDFLLQNAGRSPTELEIVCKSWNESWSGFTYGQAMAEIMKQTYKNIQDLGFAAECHKHGLPKDKFSAAQTRYLASLKIPDFIGCELGEFKEGELTGYFLKRNDPRGLFLGHYTLCCQHITGEGKECAWFGQENFESGFFVIQKGRKILAQSWVWTNVQNDVVFDNIESIGLEFSVQNQISKIYGKAAQAFAEKRFNRILIGSSSDIMPTTQIKSKVVFGLEVMSEHCRPRNVSPPLAIRAHESNDIPRTIDIKKGVGWEVPENVVFQPIAYPDKGYSDASSMYLLDKGPNKLLKKYEKQLQVYREAAAHNLYNLVFHRGKQDEDLINTSSWMGARAISANHLAYAGDGNGWQQCGPIDPYIDLAKYSDPRFSKPVYKKVSGFIAC